MRWIVIETDTSGTMASLLPIFLPLLCLEEIRMLAITMSLFPTLSLLSKTWFLTLWMQTKTVKRKWPESKMASTSQQRKGHCIQLHPKFQNAKIISIIYANFNNSPKSLCIHSPARWSKPTKTQGQAVPRITSPKLIPCHQRNCSMEIGSFYLCTIMTQWQSTNLRSALGAKNWPNACSASKLFGGFDHFSQRKSVEFVKN